MYRTIVKSMSKRVFAGCLLSALIAVPTAVFAEETPSSIDTATVPSPGVGTDVNSDVGNAAPVAAPALADQADDANADQIIREARKIAGLPGEPAAPAAPAPAPTGARSFLTGVASKAGEVVVGALNMIGVRYRWGGNTPDSGLDCSGFVRYVFQDTLGLSLPRRAEEMSRVGEKVSVRDLKPGDLVFFNTMRRTFSHVGIYIGDNKFVHSPSTGSTIRVDELDTGYWEKRFTGARRVDIAYTPAEQEQMKARMQELVGPSKPN
jgi:cell wall-associated NlpC family hydrolase